ncbi:MAG: PD40 domain-containing protein, partial [Deltaproteobacteria bacterium]|nr:PD40 domain-containing protein [Deltaproteobacteria bacterium]
EVQASAESWRRFLLAHVGSSFTLTVEESDGGGAERAQRVLTLHLAAADLTSTVYYWAVDRGRIVRIDADSLDPIDLAIPAQGTDNGCRACHTLSANGQRMAFTYYGGNGPGGVYDTGGTSVLLDDAARTWNFSALSPDGSLLLTNMAKRIMLRDGNTGLPIPGQADIGARDASQPAFSPTGTMIAFAGDLQMAGGGAPSWEIDFDLSNLYVADVDPVGRTVNNVRQLVPGNGRCLYFPSFNPDGTLVAYTDGTHSRSTTPGDLWLAKASDLSGDAPRVKLTQANPNATAYAPTFNPKVEGGYQWIAFYSRRAYGHHTAEGWPQIWVAAVDANADPQNGLDPSHPPFWLPGQAESSENLSSFFAPRPCSETGGLCDADASCCGDGLCRPVNGVSQCVPPEEACTLTGDPCGSDGECCDGLNCLLHPETGAYACLPPGTTCSEEGQLCLLDADCCDPGSLCLDDGTGTMRCAADSCAHMGESCNDARPCCDAGTVCSNDRCIPIGG